MASFESEEDGLVVKEDVLIPLSMSGSDEEVCSDHVPSEKESVFERGDGVGDVIT